MVPLQAGDSRVGRAMRRMRNLSSTAALAVSLVLGGVLAQSSLAQPASPGLDPGFFPATGYRIATPAMLDYFQHRGGVRTFGYPISNEFPLLGKRVQMFQRHVLQLAADGTVSPMDILSDDVLPIAHIDSMSLPPADADLLGSAPPPDEPDYATQAISFVTAYVPDEWNGEQVDFQSTFVNAVTCADAFGSDPCDPTLLASYALALWGLPTSLPTSDPINPDFAYQRFQRGIMHYSRATGLTQGLLVGDWLKRVMIGVDLSPDMGTEVRTSRFFAQYAPSRPLALDRPTDLPDTSLAQAFRADTLMAAGQPQPESTLPSAVAGTATSVAQTAVAISATQAALAGQQNFLTATALALTATAFPTTTALITPTATPGEAVSNIPVDTSGCLGDEQMWFVPRKPKTGTHVQISVTSQRHHDVRAMQLGGPVDPGTPIERLGPLGFVWTWTIIPVIEDFYQWTFFADGLRPCITSGFNAFAPLGATPTATTTSQPTSTPGPTATATATVVPAPTVSDVTPNSGLTCNELLTIRGTNFGSPPSTFGTSVFLINGSHSTTLQQFGTGSNTQLRVQTPSLSVTAGAPSFIQVSNAGGDSGLVSVSFATGC